MLDFKFTGTNEILKKALTKTSGAFTGQTWKLITRFLVWEIMTFKNRIM
jgi:hypothetical protein